MTEEADKAVFDQMAYRRALGGFGTGVALIAADDDQGRSHGLIINSLTSVSLHPPIMLWCLANSSAAFGVFTKAPAFSVNILRSGDEAVAKQFSRKGDRILLPEQICRMETGAPVLCDAVASLDCRMRLLQPMGDHEVIYGDVIAYRADAGVDALGFFRGQYVTLKSGSE
jgi:flavin-dependent trigonelline monooxygenase, reductase component